MKTIEIAADISASLEREKVFTALYEKAFPAGAKFVSQRGGSFSDAQDIFQDTLVIFYEKLTSETVSILISEEVYILGIAKHLWIKKYKGERTTVSLTEMERAIQIPDDYFPTVELAKLLRVVEVAGKKCLEVLRAFYYDKLSMQDVTRKFGYINAHSATVQKFKCIEKIRDKVKEKSMRYEDFTE